MPEDQTNDAILNDRLSDWGPRYTETPAGNYPFPDLIVEPWNAVTAAVFIAVGVFWIFRLHGRYRRFPFLTCCMPLLLTGGIGGTLFHALRASPTFFLMDVLPIYGLGVAISVYLWFHVGPKLHYLIGMIGLLGLLQLLGHWKLPTQWAVNVSYATLAAIVMAPMGIVLYKTKFRFGKWIVSALACFAIAWVCRIVDHLQPLPMGTHWLWHLFGAGTTVLLCEYFYRLEKEGIPDWLKKRTSDACEPLA